MVGPLFGPSAVGSQDRHYWLTPMSLATATCQTSLSICVIFYELVSTLEKDTSPSACVLISLAYSSAGASWIQIEARRKTDG